MLMFLEKQSIFSLTYSRTAVLFHLPNFMIVGILTLLSSRIIAKVVLMEWVPTSEALMPKLDSPILRIDLLS